MGNGQQKRRQSDATFDTGFDHVRGRKMSVINARKMSEVVYGDEHETNLDIECEKLSKYQFPFENIALEGGGVKGLAYSGSVKVRTFTDSEINV